MPLVKVLNPDVIAKIAAGEVVERPGSVVKELVENSLDAGSDHIEVHLKDAGKELIHIKDNGCGIAQDDLQQIFKRHATSKIQSIDDLQMLSSMGFRGEALYSVAAVSDIVLRSKTSVHDGWEIHLQGGERLDLKPAALSNHGTEIKITQLFYNTPARRKFLKSTTAEIQHILGVFLPYCLLYSSKRFVLTHAGKTLLELNSKDTAIDRMAHALNLEAKDLIESTQEFKELSASVRMVLSNINVQRPRRDLQFMFINNRPVESKNISFNINDVYRLILPPGVYPSYILDIHMDPSQVDVNIHPTKREVRIRQEARLVSFIRHMVEYTLMQNGQAKSLRGPAVLLGQTGQGQVFSPEQIIFNPSQAPLAYSSPLLDTPSNQPTGHFDASHWQTPKDHLFVSSHESLKDKLARARYIGSFIHKYLLFEADQSIFLVDQHAAQERIMFEKFQEQINRNSIEVQHLLTPVLLKLSPSEKIAWPEAIDVLKDIGIEASLFDEDTLAVHSQPVLLKGLEKAVRVLLSGDGVGRCDRLTIARRACKASIVTGDKMDASQANFQRQQLLSCHDPLTCPHGRPTVVEMSESFLDKQFLRI